MFTGFPNTLLVPTPGTAHYVSGCFRGRRGTATRYAPTTKENQWNRTVRGNLLR